MRVKGEGRRGRGEIRRWEGRPVSAHFAVLSHVRPRAIVLQPAHAAPSKKRSSKLHRDEDAILFTFLGEIQIQPILSLQLIASRVHSQESSDDEWGEKQEIKVASKNRHCTQRAPARRTR